jgi:hypothetical protein
MPEPSTTEGRCIQGELKDLLEGAAVRQAESSASRRRADPSEHHTVYYHHQVLGGDEAGAVTRGLPTGMPVGRGR